MPILTVVPFTFTLDGTRTATNDQAGNARFDNVPAGAHVVTEQIAAPWSQTLVTPAAGVVTVAPGANCAIVVFQNRQTSGQGNVFGVTQTDGRTTAAVNDTLTYTITVNNLSGLAASNVRVIDTLPSDTTYLTASDSPTVTGNIVTWVIPSIPANQSRTLTLQVRVNPGVANATTLRNFVQVLGNTVASAEDTTVVQGTSSSCAVDIQITDSPDGVEPGEKLKYKIRIRNRGSTDCRVDVIQTLDDQVEFDDASDDGDEDDGTIEWNDVEIDANDEITLTSTVFVDDDADDGDRLETEVFIGSENDEETTRVEDEDGDDDDDDDNDDEDDDDDDDNEDGDLAVTAEANQAEVFPGGTVEYTVTVENTGDSTLRDIVVTDEMQSAFGLTLIDDGGADGALGRLTWKISSLAAGKTKILRYRVIVDSSLPPGQVIATSVSAENDDAEDGANTRVTVIGSLPQTGFDGLTTGGFGLRGGSGNAHLRPFSASSEGGLPLSAAVAVAGMGLASGGAMARKWLLGF